jgi:hypothetical protein
MHRPDDEHVSVPTWRMRQLQAIEDAARESVEMIREQGWPCAGEVRDLLADALESHE